MKYDELKALHAAKPKRRSSNHESQLQIDCVKWFRMQYRQYSGCFFSVPNGGQRSKITAQILKAEGALSGVSDLILMIPNEHYNALCIEMKWGKGTQSENQKAFQNNVTNWGYKYVVCRSIEEFIKEVNTYLKDA